MHAAANSIGKLNVALLEFYQAGSLWEDFSLLHLSDDSSHSQALLEMRSRKVLSALLCVDVYLSSFFCDTDQIAPSTICRLLN
jgi:hypothetical protein